MTSIRAFIISSSVFLSFWLAASYTTHFKTDQHAPAATRQAPASANTADPTTQVNAKETVEPVAHVR